MATDPTTGSESAPAKTAQSEALPLPIGEELRADTLFEARLLPTGMRRLIYLVAALVCAMLAALPFLVVRLVPITDLPQQTAQVRLLSELRSGPVEAAGPNPSVADREPLYRVQWWHPNKLGYAPLIAAWAFVSPLDAGRWGMLILAVAWVLAVHFLAYRTGRSPAAAALAAALFFNHVTYWGLLNFLAGLPAFVWFFVVAERAGPGSLSRRRGLQLLAAAGLLYLAHVLWLAAALLWLLLLTVAQRQSWTVTWRSLWSRALWLSPTLLAVALWYPTLGRADFDSETVWGQNLLQRLDPRWLLNSALGGMYGQVEALLASALLAWLVWGLWSGYRARHTGQHGEVVTARVQPASLGALLDKLKEEAEGPASGMSTSLHLPGEQQVHRPLLLAAAVFFVLAFALPAVHQGTVLFASRWVPMGAAFLLLALPTPRLRLAPSLSLSWLLLGSLCIVTSLTWVEVEQEELAGLEVATHALPTGPRVLGVDLVRISPRIRGFPYYHLYAYAQVAKGGELNRSFAEFASSLVVYRELPRANPWTFGLDWKPHLLRRSDVPYFDHLIVHAREEGHQLFVSDPRLVAVTEAAPWRLYRVRPEARQPR